MKLIHLINFILLCIGFILVQTIDDSYDDAIIYNYETETFDYIGTSRSQKVFRLSKNSGAFLNSLASFMGSAFDLFIKVIVDQTMISLNNLSTIRDLIRIKYEMQKNFLKIFYVFADVNDNFSVD